MHPPNPATILTAAARGSMNARYSIGENDEGTDQKMECTWGVARWNSLCTSSTTYGDS